MYGPCDDEKYLPSCDPQSPHADRDDGIDDSTNADAAEKRRKHDAFLATLQPVK